MRIKITSVDYKIGIYRMKITYSLRTKINSSFRNQILVWEMW